MSGTDDGVLDRIGARPWPHVGALVVGCLLGAAACGQSNVPEGFAPPFSEDAASYVALGDSFVSGPGIEPIDPDSRVCQRSEANWPHFLADDLGLDLTDVSCAGATTGHLLRDVPTAESTLPAQVSELTRRTDLVTVTIGANNYGLLGGLIGACADAGSTSATQCEDHIDGLFARSLARVERDVVHSLATVRRLAPEAAVVLVGYLRIAPVRGGCTDLPIGADHSEEFGSGERSIDDMLASSARAAGVQYVSAWRLSEGHDVCSSEPWVNGATPTPLDGVVLHPRKAGMRAMAAAIARTLTERSVNRSTARWTTGNALRHSGRQTIRLP